MLQLCPQGPLHVERLIEVYGRKGNMSKWLSDLKGDQSATHTACTNAATCCVLICRKSYEAEAIINPVVEPQFQFTSPCTTDSQLPLAIRR